MKGYFAFAAFAATVPLANWMIGNVGTSCVPSGPCVIPVGFGLHAPSGVLVVGAALVLRDAVHRNLGAKWALSAIGIGAAASSLVAPPSFVLASVSAFVLSELADFLVYAPLWRRRLALAVLTSGIVGATVDSAVFVMIAFGSLDYVEGQIVGKVWVSLIAALAIIALRRAERVS